MSIIDSFQDYQDIWQDADDIWHRGATDDALDGCVLVNPTLAATITLVTKPLMTGALSVIEYMKGILTVKPYE